MRARAVELLVFAAGAATLGAEIGAARLLAPSFGASTIVWANTIAVVLVALAGGYWAGGTLADRHPHTHGLARAVLAGAALLALAPLACEPLLHASQDVLSTFSGSLLGVLVLVAPPVLVLGTVAPWAIRLRLEAVADAGDVAGRIYALSTAGSLLGTFVAALGLLPLIGTRWTFLTLATTLAAVAAPAAFDRRSPASG